MGSLPSLASPLHLSLFHLLLLFAVALDLGEVRVKKWRHILQPLSHFTQLLRCKMLSLPILSGQRREALSEGEHAFLVKAGGVTAGKLAS